MPAVRFALALPPSQVAWADYLAAAQAADALAFEIHDTDIRLSLIHI